MIRCKEIANVKVKVVNPIRSSDKRRRSAVKILAAMQPPPNLSIDEWADLYRSIITRRIGRTGLLVDRSCAVSAGMMRAISDPTVERVVFMTGAQIGQDRNHQQRGRIFHRSKPVAYADRAADAGNGNMVE